MAGFERCAPALPAFGVGGCGGGDVHDLLPAVPAVRKLAGAARWLLGVASDLAADHFSLRPCGLVDRLADVHRLWEALRVQPCERVAHLESCVLDGDGEAVPGARAAEREQVTARFQDAQALSPQARVRLDPCPIP